MHLICSTLPIFCRGGQSTEYHIPAFDTLLTDYKFAIKYSNIME